MKNNLFSLGIFALLVPDATAQVGSVRFPDKPVIYAAEYGATPGDNLDDRPAIQAACAAAALHAGGGRVVLGPGNFEIYVLYDATTTFGGGKTKLDGHYGLEIPAGVILEGAGMEATALVGYKTTDNADTGAIVAPLGWRSADVAYECGAPQLKNLSVYASDTNATETGIAVAVVHSDGFILENLRLGPCYYHGIDHGYAKNTVVRGCVFRGPYAYSSSGGMVQMDAGDAGANSTHLSKSAAPNSNISFFDCLSEQRPDTDTAPRDWDLAHSNCEVRGLRVERCIFYGRNNSTDTAIVGIDTTSTSGIYNDFNFTGCTFYVYANAGNDVNDYAIRAELAVTAGELQRWRIQNCAFNGQALNMVALGNGSSSSVTATTWASFKGYHIVDNTFNYSQEGLAGGATKSCLLAFGLQEATIRGNKAWITGAQASASTIYPFYLNNCGGSIYDNIRHQSGTITAEIAFVHDCAGAETACQAGTIPFWRAAFFANASFGPTTNGHFWLRGANGIDGGSTYNYTFWGNSFNGAGSYDLAFQYFASSASNAAGGGQVLGTSGSVNFGSMAAGAEDTQTLAVTGARSGNTTATVEVGWSAALEQGIVIKQVWVSATDTVSIRALNTTAGTVDPAAVTARVTVRQF